MSAEQSGKRAAPAAVQAHTVPRPVHLTAEEAESSDCRLNHRKLGQSITDIAHPNDLHNVSTIETINMTSPDGITVGSRETDYGASQLLFLEKRAKSPIFIQ